MKFFGIRIGGKKFKHAQGQEEQETQDAITISQAQQKKQLTIAKVPRLRNPGLVFKQRTGTGEFEHSEYDLIETGRIADVEGYAQSAFTLKEGLLLKEGWEYTGKNVDTIKYIKERFRQIGQASGQSFKEILRGVGEDLIQFHNAFLVKVRDVNKSGGKVREVPGTNKKLNPVAGYFHLPVTTIQFKRDKNGKILKYRQQVPGGEYKDFRPEDIIHFSARKKKGFLIGTPPLTPVKDDIRALRRIEENVEMLVYQHLFPLFHYTVGTEDAPAETYPDGTTEVQEVRRNLEIMPAEGMIVTPERHEIDAIGAAGRALQVEGILEHFKRRVLAGLGISAIDVGEGDSANRSTADNMSRNLIDGVKNYQSILAEQINRFIINELLRESTFSDPLTEDNIVEIVFHEIDVDAKIKRENHNMLMFQGNQITHSEMRRAVGREPFTDEDWEDSAWKLIDEPKALIQAVDEPYTAAAAAAKNPQTAIEQGDIDQARKQREKEAKLATQAKTSGTPGPKSKKESGGVRSARSKDMPSNQHGGKITPEKRKSFATEDIIFSDKVVAVGNKVTKIYDEFREDILRAARKDDLTIEWLRALSQTASSQMKENLERVARIRYRTAYRSTGADLDFVDEQLGSQAISNRIDRIISRYVSDLVDNISNKFTPTTKPDALEVGVVFDTMKFRSRFIFNSELNKAYNYGTAMGLTKLGQMDAIVIAEEDTCEDCQAKAGPINLVGIGIEDVPGWHANCRCYIERAK